MSFMPSRPVTADGVRHLQVTRHPAVLPPPRRPVEFLCWRDNWSHGVDFMDQDHRVLTDMINRLARDYGSSDSPRRACPLSDALGELDAATRAHFQREESAMRAQGYEGLAAHKGEHDLLLAELRLLARQLEASGADWLDRDELEVLKDWFLGHVLEMDRELAASLLRS